MGRAARAVSISLPRFSKSRGAYLMGLTTYGKYEIEDQVNFTVYVPKVDDIFYNTVGGMIGGLMYCAVMKVRKRL